MKHTLNIVCALNCEAKAIVDRYKLKKANDKPFSVFSGDALLNETQITIHVLISGVGALNMATSIGWLAARQAVDKSLLYPSADVWLNVGIAGHADLDVGKAFVVSRSSDLLSTRAFYPPQVARRPVALSPCLSLNAPSSDYPDEGGIDMEASAFFNAACRFSNAECIQAFKIVSDNPGNGLDDLDAKRIHQLILPHADAIEQFASGLFDIQPKVQSHNEIQVNKILADLLQDQHATHAQRTQLSSMMVHLGYMLTANDFAKLCEELVSYNDTKVVLSSMRSRIELIMPSIV